MTKIKMCGLYRLEDISYANEVKPEYVGFVYAPKSKRFVTDELSAEMKKKLDSSIRSVGVFVDEPVEHILKLVHDKTIDIVQLHGNEDDEYIGEIRKHSDVCIIKAFKVRCREDVIRAQTSAADYILLDSENAGSGICFDWELLSCAQRNFFLAGGLNPDNVKDALGKVHPFAVDVSSGIETDKIKDINKMKAFADAVRKGL